MRTLVWITLALLSLTTLLVTAVYALPPRQPVSAVMLDLRLTDCLMPCWAGIMPGQTTMDEAHDQLLKTFPEQARLAMTRDERGIWMAASLHDNSVLIVLVASDSQSPPRVNWIRLAPTPIPDLFLSDILYAQGTMTCRSGPFVIYESRRAAALLYLRRVGPRAALSTSRVDYFEFRSRRLQPDMTRARNCD
jgi:hypothetical protein